MPSFVIQLRNATFNVQDEGEHINAAAAMAQGVEAAIHMAGDEVLRGHQNSAIEVTIIGADGVSLLTSVVVTSVTAMLPAQPSAFEDVRSNG